MLDNSMTADLDADARATATYPARRANVSELHVADVVIEALDGPLRGRRCTLDPQRAGRSYIGRSAVADLRLDDPRVSRRHAAIEVTDHDIQISDLESKNGTFVNGVRVLGAFLSTGDVVRLGGLEVRVEIAPRTTRIALTPASAFGRMLGVSPQMRRLYPVFERAAQSMASLVIAGEVGTGKELLAEALHEEGPRASGPFVVFDCTAPPARGEGALFAEAEGLGALERARGGTLLLDELAELAPGYQATLLHVLRHVTDVRIIVATRRDLEREVQEGRFREDLYYRLATTQLELPPLRRREGDVAHLAARFWSTAGGTGPLPDELLRRVTTYAWPGNVRELQNDVMNRLMLGPLAEESGGLVTSDGDVIAQVMAENLGFSQARRHVIDAFETRYLEWILGKHAGNVSRAAAASGIARRHFYTVRHRTRT